MRNYIKHALIIAFAAALVMAFTACDSFFGDDDAEQTVYTITGIPAENNGKWAYGGLSDPNGNSKKARGTAIALHSPIADGSVTLEMFKAKDYSPASVAQNTSAWLVVCVNASNNSTTGDTAQKFRLVSSGPGPFTVEWSSLSDFTEN